MHDMLAARAPDSPLVHEHWGDNVFLETFVDVDIAKAFDAPIKVTRETPHRAPGMAPLEGRGVVAAWDHAARAADGLHRRPDAAHHPHRPVRMSRRSIRRQVRVVSPDVGGGFGYKGILLPEEVCLSWLAMQRGHPVRWIEDRREHLTASANCREHHYVITAYADRDGTLRGIDCEATVDSGAYSSYPFSACLEAAQVASILPGPYDFAGLSLPHLVGRDQQMPDPALSRRRAHRRLLCAGAHARCGRARSRARAARGAAEESGAAGADAVRQHHQQAFRQRRLSAKPCAAPSRRSICRRIRERQRRGEPDGRLIGFGLAIYCEQGAHGTSVYAGWGIPMVPGHEQATARMTPDGGLELRVGVHSHGQGLETTLAQVAHEILGVDVAKIRVVHGDTALTPYSTGTWGSRCVVMAGGAVASACREIARAGEADRREAAAGRSGERQLRATAASSRPPAASASPRSPAPGICGRRICPATSIPAASR